MRLENTSVIAHESMGGGGYRLLTMESHVIAALVRPGQFVHLRIPRLDGATLRRPFSVFRAERESLAILYKTVGRGTAAMQTLAAGDQLSLLGPLGNGFPLELNGAVPLLVAGGYGMAALYLLARALPHKGVVLVGGAAAKDILCVPEFEELGWEVQAATEDGSCGTRGQVTVLLDPWLRNRDPRTGLQVYACGPNGMLKAVADRALAGGWKAWLSMDRHMGCGAGACLACVQRVRRGQTTAWARVCKDGPVFEAGDIVWAQR